MTTTFEFHADEVSKGMMQRIIAGIKKVYKGKKVVLTVDEALDETEYLLGNPANARILEERMRNVEKGKNLVEVTMSDLKKMVRDAK